MPSAFEGKDFGLGAEDVDTNRFAGLGEELLPLFDPVEDERNNLCSLELPASRVDPDHRLPLLRTEQDHVVVRRDDHLVSALGMTKYGLVTRTSRWRLVAFVADVASLDSELPQS